MIPERTIIRAVFVVLATFDACHAACCAKSSCSPVKEELRQDPIDKILQDLKQKTAELESYQADVEYLFKQPLFESQTLRKGVLYYARFARESRLRMNFQTLKQDDEKEQKYLEHYVFDGIWLTQIDYQLEAGKHIQLADPNALKDANEPPDAFELVSRNLPIVGFSKTEHLRKEFVIRLVEGEPAKLIQLHLEVKPDSVYKDDYTSMDFWIDKKSGLPARMVAVSTEEDIQEIKLLKPQPNKKIDRKVFLLKIPEGFDIQEVPLKRTGERTGEQQKGKVD